MRQATRVEILTGPGVFSLYSCWDFMSEIAKVKWMSLLTGKHLVRQSLLTTLLRDLISIADWHIRVADA